MAPAPATPTTTPAAIPATFEEPPESESELAVDEVLDDGSGTLCVTTTVVPCAMLVTTVGVVGRCLRVRSAEVVGEDVDGADDDMGAGASLLCGSGLDPPP